MKINHLTSMYNTTIDLGTYQINAQFTQVNASSVTEVNMTVIRVGEQNPDKQELAPDIVVGEFSKVVNIASSVRITIMNADDREEIQNILQAIYNAYDQIIAEYTSDNA